MCVCVCVYVWLYNEDIFVIRFSSSGLFNCLLMRRAKATSPRAVASQWPSSGLQRSTPFQF